jgi:polyisoprenoid-binding protein YceI
MFAPLALVALAAAASPGSGQRYAVAADQSTVTIRVGRAGLFKFAGHEHVVVAPAFRGEVVADAGDLSRSSVWVTFESAALRVTGEGEPAGDVPKVQAAMVGPKVLDAERFPEIAFRSRAVSGHPAGAGAWELSVTGDLTLHGVTRAVTLPLKVQLSGETLAAAGTAVIRHTDYGLKPVSVAGVVNVRNEIGVEFRITARVAP